MGSSPSVIEVPAGHHLEAVVRTKGSAPATSRNRQRFQEVEIQHADGSRGGSRGAASRQGAAGGKRREHVVGSSSDISTVVSQVQREKTLIGESEQPQYSEDEDLVLETFYHKSGTVYTCLYQNGKRFYLDSWQSQDWERFPKEWYKEGFLVTDRIIKNDQTGEEAAYSGGAAPNAGDDREGFIDHPSKGRLPTYVFEEKRNVHYYFEKESGCWVRLPISYELRSDLIQRLMASVEEALPGWTDKQDMLAALRTSNYDPHDCIATYLTIGDQDDVAVARNAGDAKILAEKEERLQLATAEATELRGILDRGKKKLDREREGRRAAEHEVSELRETVTSLEAELAMVVAQFGSLRDRPATARPTSARSGRNSRSQSQLQLKSDSDSHSRPPSRSSSKMSVPSPEPIPTPEPSNQVDPDTVLAIQEDVRMLHKDYARIKMEAQSRFEEVKIMMKQLMVGVTKISISDAGYGDELEQVKELYRRETLQRRLLYNKLQEMRGNIRVFCRCRYDDRTECCLTFPSDREVLPPNGKKAMKFDRVFTTRSRQDEVFEEAKPTITSCIDGYNVCIMAYGQTGSGKTYTMQGSRDDPGVNVRSIKELLQMCDEKENVQYSLKASMVEIYNETIHDLLTSACTQLDIRTQGNKIHLPGMTEMFVESLSDIDDILKLGDKNRHVASTKMNSVSSRSHLVFIITVEGMDKASGAVTTGTLTLCDLAGSERVGKTEAEGQRLVEAAAINKSLTALGQVFSALRSGQLHIPYRNSKLTHLLQPSLGGDAKACLFVNVSPDISNVTESISTMTFGSNARQVALGQAKQNMAKRAPPANGAWGMEEL